MFSFLLSAQTADAFGISPPHVINDRLFPGAHYEQKITLSRTDTEQAVRCKLAYNTAGFENWISFDPSASFEIPAGQKVAVLTVKIDVPKDAKPGRQRGSLQITSQPLQVEQGKINIVLGAQIEMDLTVTSEKFSEMLVKQVKINDIEPNWKIKVDLKIENKGNVAVKPDRVSLDVYDSSFKELMLVGRKDRLFGVKPFQTREVGVFFSQNKLSPGQYWGHVKVYKGGDVAWEEKAIFTVHPKGTLPAQPDEPLFDAENMPAWGPYAAVGLVLALLLVIASLAALRMRSKKHKKR